MITADILRDNVAYEPETGIFTWRKTKRRSNRIGQVAGKKDPRGYVSIKIDQVRYYAHRLAWLYVTGAFPKYQIDHRDLDKSNNRFSNLREATPIQNSRNTPVHTRNKSGLKGVFYCKQHKRWVARIQVNKKARHLGVFSSAELAHEAYVTAANQYFGEFARAA